MNDELEKKWREEILEISKNQMIADGCVNTNKLPEEYILKRLSGFDGYIIAKKSSQIETEILKVIIETSGRSVEHWMNESEKRDRLLEQAKVPVKYFACVSDEIIERKDADQWLKDHEALKGDRK